MFGSEQSQQRIGRFAWWMAWFGLVMGQLHAMSRHATEEGSSDLDADLVRAWSDPGRDLFAPLLEWASPNTVYLTYGKLWLPVFVAFTLAAFVVHHRRSPVGVEKWAWRVMLTTYTIDCISVVAEYWTQWGEGNEKLLDTVFLIGIPFYLLTLLGSSFLGIVLLRRGLGFPALLLTLTFPLAIAISEVTSMGSTVLPIAFAFGILGRRISREHTTYAVAPVSDRTTA